MYFSVPVCGVWHIDVPRRELQDLPGGAYPTVWVRFDLQKVRGQAIVGVLGSWRNVQLQLGCGDSDRRQSEKGEGVQGGKEREKNDTFICSLQNFQEMRV